MPTATANGLTATAVRGVPNTWIVRISESYYEAIETNGVSISDVDTSIMLTPGDYRWSSPGRVHRTHVGDYDTAEDGRRLAGWYVEVHHNTAEPYRRATDALSALKMQLRSFHNSRKA